MDVFYWKTPQGNFGDDLNDWLWDSLLPGWRNWAPGTTLVGVGTILNTVNFPTDKPGHFLVAGSGVGYGEKPELGDASRWDIRSLRGPRSAVALDLPPSYGIIDPAIMLSDLAEFQNLPRQGRPIFIPHLSSVNRHDWQQLCDAAGIDYVSPCGDSHEVVRRIATAPLVLAESMHAAIIADTFRTPWTATSISASFNGVKWLDWADSVQVDLTIQPLFPRLTGLEKYLSRNRKSKSAGGEMPHGAAPKTGGKTSRRRQARLVLERWFARSALRAQLKRPSSLSRDTVLQAQKQRYKDMLATIIRDYGHV